MIELTSRVVVGTKGAGATLRATGRGVARIPGSVAAHTSRALLATGNAIGRIPTLADITRGATNTFHGFRTHLFGGTDTQCQGDEVVRGAADPRGDLRRVYGE